MAVHIADDVHHMAVALDNHEITHLDRAIICHATDVVSGQINEHDVFGTLLWIIQQFVCQSVIFTAGLSPPARASDWADVDATVQTFDMNLR